MRCICSVLFLGSKQQWQVVLRWKGRFVRLSQIFRMRHLVLPIKILPHNWKESRDYERLSHVGLISEGYVVRFVRLSTFVRRIQKSITSNHQLEIVD